MTVVEVVLEKKKLETEIFNKILKKEPLSP